jgi:hypothetical protein
LDPPLGIELQVFHTPVTLYPEVDYETPVTLYPELDWYETHATLFPEVDYETPVTLCPEVDPNSCSSIPRGGL